jgi:hypothetical protein
MVNVELAGLKLRLVCTGLASRLPVSQDPTPEVAALPCAGLGEISAQAVHLVSLI